MQAYAKHSMLCMAVAGPEKACVRMMSGQPMLLPGKREVLGLTTFMVSGCHEKKSARRQPGDRRFTGLGLEAWIRSTNCAPSLMKNTCGAGPALHG